MTGTLFLRIQNPAYRLAIFFIFFSPTVKISKIRDFLSEEIWRIQYQDVSRKQFILVKIGRVLILAIREFINDKCPQKASALTYYSLLSIVPLAAMAFGVAKGFGFETALENQLLKSLYGQEEVVAWIMDFAHKYLSTIKGGMIAGVGFVMLLWSVMNVLGGIELSFNEIWEVKRSRSFIRKFSDYVSLMLIGLLFLVSSGSIIVNLSSSLEGAEVFKHFWAIFTTFAPYVLIWFIFSMLFYILPNTKVKFSAALVGGIIAGTLFQLTQYFYIYFQMGMSRYNAIYGSFAAFPLFLIWLQVSWVIVLLGAEISFAFQNVKSFEYESDTRTISYSYKKLLSIFIAQYIVKQFSKGEKAPTAEEISVELHLPIKLVMLQLFEMVEAGVISEIQTPKNQSNAFQPSLDIHRLTILKFIQMMERKGSSNFQSGQSAAITRLQEVLSHFETEVEKFPENILLKDI